jgi:Flp pilus assembly pilin Flp
LHFGIDPGRVETSVKTGEWHLVYENALSRRTGMMLDYAKIWLALRLDRRAVTALEYGLIAGVIVAVITVGFTTLANSLSTKFVHIGQSL